MGSFASPFVDNGSPAVIHGITLDQHSRSATVHSVVDFAIIVDCMIPDINALEAYYALVQCAACYAFPKERINLLRKQCLNIKLHYLCISFIDLVQALRKPDLEGPAFDIDVIADRVEVRNEKVFLSLPLDLDNEIRTCLIAV